MLTPMRIGINATKLLAEKKTGVEYYTWSLLSELLRQDPINEYILYSPEKLPSGFASSNVLNVVLPYRNFWVMTALRSYLLRHPVDMFFEPAQILSFGLPKEVRVVTAILDLAFYLYPHSYSPKDYLWSLLAVRQAVGRADRVVVVSQQTKKDLVKHFKIIPSKVEVIYPGLPPGFGRDDRVVKPTLAVPYFFYVGRIELRKNLDRLVESFALFQERFPGKPFKLVLAGEDGYGADLVRARIQELSLEGKVVLPGYLEREEIVGLYKNAKGVVFPSKYEGFGFPILEAWAADVPLLTSNKGAMKEVAEEAGVLVDSDEVESIAKGLEELAFNGPLRARLVRAGKKRLEEFSWQNAGASLLSVFRELEP